jgi:hypothetical protein
MDSHAHMCDLQGKQHKGTAQEQGPSSLMSSKSLPSDDVRHAAWKYDQQQQQEQENGHEGSVHQHHHHRAVYQEPPHDSSGSGAAKLTASLGRLLKSASRLLTQDHTRTKRLYYSELAAAAEGSYSSQSAKEPEEGQVRGQQFFSLGSSQDLLLGAGSQPTESEADTQTPCGSGPGAHLLLEDGSGHSSSAAHAAAAARASPGSVWLQSMLHPGRTGAGAGAGGGVKRHLSSSLGASLLSSSSEELAAAAAAAGAANSKQVAASPSSTGWELTSTGAANPCGSLHSTLLDLFADMVEDMETVTW